MSPGERVRIRVWTPEVIMQALLRFYTEYGFWPTSFDFQPRVRPEYLPHFCTIWRHFGGLDLACHATEIAYLSEPPLSKLQ